MLLNSEFKYIAGFVSSYFMTLTEINISNETILKFMIGVCHDPKYTFTK